MTLTVWSFTPTASTPTGMCKVDLDYGVITCPGGDAFVDARAALMDSRGNHVTRFSCRVIGRDDQGDLHCAPGKPTLDYDATEVLQSFARKCALDVIHLWKGPPVIKRYLRTGDPKLRGAALVATRGAARNTARDVAGSAIWAVIGASGKRAAWVGAWVGARNAAWDATREIAAGDAAKAATGDAAWATTRDAATACQSRRLAHMLQAGAHGSR